jgi:hypothetical protein
MWRIAILVLLVLAVNLPANAKPNKYEKHNKAEKISKQQQTESWSEEIFSPAERNMIRAQLQQEERNKKQKKQKKHKNLPPGVQKKVARGKELPPGWQKKVAPGDSLDYQVYRQGLNLPEEILRRLPQQPTGSEIIQIDDRIIRLNSATRTILDVFNLNPTP